MWFKNLAVYRVPARWDLPAEKLESYLQTQAFAPASQLEEMSAGWAPVLDQHGGLVYPLGGQLLMKLRIERKLLPAKVVSQVVKERAAQIESEEGFKPGRKQLKELKETVRDELLPKAFGLSSEVFVWIDPVNGWLVIDTSSANQAADIFGLLARAIDQFPGHPLKLNGSVGATMTNWLEADDAAPGFTIDQDLELRGRDGKSVVRYANLTALQEDVVRHIREDRQCSRLALTWNDRISFVLTDKAEIKRLRPLDVISESNQTVGNDAVERFESDMTLMTAELSKMLADIVDGLGGFEMAQAA